MASFKQVTLKDPTTGDYLSPRVYGAIEYEVVEDGTVVPPYDTNADTLQGHPASDFLLKSEYTPVDAIPTGVICMWSGESTAIPSGWHLCDGEEGTPDLRDRFIVGAGSTYEVGNTGGENSVTLSSDQIPPHSHTASISANDLKVSSSGSHSHSYTSARTGSVRGGTSGSNTVCTGTSSGSTGSSGSHTHDITGSFSVTINDAGGGQAHENRPPYFALCFIMKL